MGDGDTKQSGLRQKLITSLRKAYERFLKIRGNPHEIALGLALGLFVGMSPTLGFQMAIAVFLAALFKWNKISSAVGVWISNPVTAPFIYGLTYYVGAKITGIHNSFGQVDTFDFALLYRILVKAPEIFWAMTLGGVILGIPIAIFGYLFAFSAVNKYQEDIKQKLARQKERLKSRKSKKREKKDM